MATATEQAPVSRDALTGYEGKWVAVRHGEVVAAADTLEELRANPATRPDDAIYVVPESESYFF